MIEVLFYNNNPSSSPSFSFIFNFFFLFFIFFYHKPSNLLIASRHIFQTTIFFPPFLFLLLFLLLFFHFCLHLFFFLFVSVRTAFPSPSSTFSTLLHLFQTNLFLSTNFFFCLEKKNLLQNTFSFFLLLFHSFFLCFISFISLSCFICLKGPLISTFVWPNHLFQNTFFFFLLIFYSSFL